MNGLVFSQPEWFWGGLILLPLLVLRIWSHLGTARRLPGLVSPRLAHRLINGATHARRWTVFVLQALALLCLLLALARPHLGFEETENEIEARNLILAIDTSRSMLSDDLAPNRLDRAKLAAQDIVLSLPDDRIGLIAFAGKPFLQAPLTVDHEAILEAIEQLDTEVIPRGGTNLTAAVTLALETVKEAKLGPSALVLFSDGEALEGLEEVERIRERAAEAGLALVTVGVGTTEGSIIPELDDNGQTIPGVFVKDERGQVVRTRLTPEPLQALAAKGGAYLHLGGSASLTQVVEQIRSGLAATREDAGKTEKPIERFLWPLSFAFALFVLSHLIPLFWLKPSSAVVRAKLRTSRALAALTCLGATFVSSNLRAEPGSVSSNANADAVALLELALAEETSPEQRAFLQLRLGAAAYQGGNFEKAADAFGGAAAEGSPRYEGLALYNLGNTLYRRGETALTAGAQAPVNPDQMQSLSAPGDAVSRAIREWEGAIEHFETALSLDPDNTKTAHNLEVVKKRLEALKKQQQEQQEQQKQDEQKKDQEKKEDDQEKQKDDSQKDDSDQKQDQDQQEKKDPQDQDSSSDEEKPEDQKGEKQGEQPQDSQKPGEKPQDPQDKEGQPDSPKDPQEGDSPGKEKPPGQNQQPDPSQTPPEQPETPQDGKLEANPNQAQPDKAQPGQPNTQPSQGQPMPRNPETGYAPTEARQLLDALADETEVRPRLPSPSQREKFKNW
jgi:Ca-activated chloride channel family protein